MNISSKNLFVRLYNFTYGKLPNDLCSFFWGTLAAVLLLPIATIGAIALPWTKYLQADREIGKIGSGFWTLAIYGALLGLGTVFMDGILDFTPWSLILFPLIIIFTMAISFAVIVGIVFLIILLIERGTPDIIENTKDWIGAVRRKHCTKITWK